MSNELKPCPFCGGNVERYNEMPGYLSGYGFYCPNCETYVFNGDDDDMAAEKWNRRANGESES